MFGTFLFHVLKNSPFYSSYFDIEFNPDELLYAIGEENIYLTEGENKLLNHLADKKNNIVLREELADPENEENDFRKIDVQVNRLRQKIEKNPKRPLFLKTVRGKGYKLITD